MMQFSLKDFRKIQAQLLVAIVAVALSFLLVDFSLDSASAAKATLRAAKTERDEIVGKLSRVRTEEIQTKEKAAVFSALQARGIIGAEQRLSWVELLESIRDTEKLLELKYEFAPQRPLEPKQAGGFNFFASNMHLQLKLLHEEDLTRLLDALRTQAKALIEVKNCRITRLPPGNSREAGLAQLQAECQIDWVTLREASQ